MRVLPLRHLLQQALVVERRRCLPTGQVEAQFAEESTQVFQLLGAGALVYTVQNGELLRLEKSCRRDIGAQHAFLDELVGIVANDRHDRLDLAVGIEDDPGLDGIEIDRATRLPRLAQHLVKLVQSLEVGDPLPIDIRLGAIGQHLTHLGVGQSGLGMDHGFIEPVITQLATGAQLHFADHGQPIDRGFQ